MAAVDLNRIQPVSEFIRNYRTVLTRIKDSRTPEVLTVNGVPECVIIDPATYQELLDMSEQERVRRAVEAGVEDVKMGREQPATQVFSELREQFGLRSKGH
jgi:PHD/YefM family antitoxin component YafN of YafNO toxin-antitoxin module